MFPANRARTHAALNRPDLFHVHYNAPKHVPFDGGDICKFVNKGPETEWKVPSLVASLYA